MKISYWYIVRRTRPKTVRIDILLLTKHYNTVLKICMANEYDY